MSVLIMVKLAIENESGAARPPLPDPLSQGEILEM